MHRAEAGLALENMIRQPGRIEPVSLLSLSDVIWFNSNTCRTGGSGPEFSPPSAPSRMTAGAQLSTHQANGNQPEEATFSSFRPVTA